MFLMEFHFTLTIAALVVGFLLAWFFGGKTRHALVAATESVAAQATKLEELGAKHDKAQSKILSLEGEIEELNKNNQQIRIQVTELERRIHDNKMWEAKYEKLLKEHNANVAKLSDFEKTKVELTFCEQKLASAKKKIGELEAAAASTGSAEDEPGTSHPVSEPESSEPESSGSSFWPPSSKIV
ncbi:MAG: hypothetical protein A2289_11255 [Deltaproteobacteria bacterium RIFOXYA12_FULL_58_15]|nr:MAG: hypothetical protein A2289_11255 [Deltaproteobacteria bacterium RIFOXYA12_FULL_58_15]